MQFRLFSFALIILNCMDYSHCQGNRWRRNKRASYVSNPICKGCLSCSKDNGCSRCQQKLFFFLRREGMRQYGECLHSCPSGYYGHRAPDMNRCARCRIENCDSCFSKDFCTKCKVGFYLHRGRCFDECPDGFAPLDETMECVEGCEVGHWSEWGTCSRNNRTCGFKWGLETRTRQIVKKPAKDTIPCPTIAESRRCKMAMRHCPGVFNYMRMCLKHLQYRAPSKNVCHLTPARQRYRLHLAKREENTQSKGEEKQEEEEEADRKGPGATQCLPRHRQS